jgi:hypothetical protein
MKRSVTFDTAGKWVDGETLVVCHHGKDFCLDFPDVVGANNGTIVYDQDLTHQAKLARNYSLLALVIAVLAFIKSFLTHRRGRGSEEVI